MTEAVLFKCDFARHRYRVEVLRPDEKRQVAGGRHRTRELSGRGGGNGVFARGAIGRSKGTPVGRAENDAVEHRLTRPMRAVEKTDAERQSCGTVAAKAESAVRVHRSW